MSSAERPTFVSAEEYLAAEEIATTKHEYVDGWVRAMTGGTVRHNQVAVNTLVHLANSLKGRSCRPYSSDMAIRIRFQEKLRFYTQISKSSAKAMLLRIDSRTLQR